MTHFRPYRNEDTPALAALWNRGAVGPAVAGPLSAHEFDRQVVGGPLFDRAGLIVAERDGKILGYAHAGFGPADDGARPLALSSEMGTVAMLVVEPGADDPEVEDGLFAAAEGYIRGRGAAVVYAGGQAPLNPFYWGVYGGSEWAGVLAGDAPFHRAAGRAGFAPVGSAVLLEADLGRPEPFDPRGVLVRRQTRVDLEEDAIPASWWQALAIGEFRPTLHRLLSRADGTELARASTWDMAWFGRRDNRGRLGLIDLEVHPAHRRKGYGRYLIHEVLRYARGESAAVVAVQTRDTNDAALALYSAAGFEPVDSATLYRKPGGPA